MSTTCTIIYDGESLCGKADRPLIDFLTTAGKKLPHVCYHPALPPLETWLVLLAGGLLALFPAAAAPLTQHFALWGLAIVMPITLAYNSWAFWVLKGKVI